MRIGVFDSGIGGITVLQELKKNLGAAEYIYLGDTANLPYGTKSASQVTKLSIQCTETLLKKKIDALVVACNTASSLALEAIQKTAGSIPVFGVVQPGVEAALKALSTIKNENELGAPVLVLATRATVQSHAYGNILRDILMPQLVPGLLPLPIFEQACPLLVPMIEEGWLNHPILIQTVAEYVKPFAQDKNPGVALLGCTHYPWIHSVFEKALPHWIVVNSAYAVVESLQKSNLFPPHSGKSSTVEWIFTDPEAVPQFAQQFITQL